MKRYLQGCGAFLAGSVQLASAQTVNMQVTYPVKENNAEFYGTDVAPELTSVSVVQEGAQHMNVVDGSKLSKLRVSLPNDFDILGDCRTDKQPVKWHKTATEEENVEEDVRKPSTRILIVKEPEPIMDEPHLTEEIVSTALEARVKKQIMEAHVPVETNAHFDAPKDIIGTDYIFDINGSPASVYSCPIGIKGASIGSATDPAIVMDLKSNEKVHGTATGEISIQHQPLGFTFIQSVLNDEVHNTSDPYKEIPYNYFLQLPEALPSIANPAGNQLIKIQYIDLFTAPLVITGCSALGNSIDEYVSYANGFVTASVPINMLRGGVTLNVVCTQIMERAGVPPLKVTVDTADGQPLYAWSGPGAVLKDAGRSMLTFRSDVEFLSEITSGKQKTGVIIDVTKSTIAGLHEVLAFERPLMRAKVTLIKTTTVEGSNKITQIYGLKNINSDDDNAQLAAISMDQRTVPKNPRGVLQQTVKFHDIAMYPEHCSDELLTRGLETDTDCGNTCAPCEDTLVCMKDTDCKSMSCEKSQFSVPGLDNKGVCAKSVGLPPSSTAGASNSAVAVIPPLASALVATFFFLLFW